MDHGPRWRPFENSEERTGTKGRDHNCFQCELQTQCTVPRNEERIFVYELTSFAFTEAFVIIDTFHLSDNPDDLVPVISL